MYILSNDVLNPLGFQWRTLRKNAWESLASRKYIVALTAWDIIGLIAISPFRVFPVWITALLLFTESFDSFSAHRRRTFLVAKKKPFIISFKCYELEGFLSSVPDDQENSSFISSERKILNILNILYLKKSYTVFNYLFNLDWLRNA